MTIEPKKPILSVVGAAIIRGDRCLAAQRSATMSLPGKWEFPGGKVEEGETPQRALARELAEELQLTCDIGRFLATGHAESPARIIRLDVYLATELSGAEPVLTEHAHYHWFTRTELGALDWAVADLPAVRAVEALLEAS